MPCLIERPSAVEERMRPPENVTITPLHLAAFHDLLRMIDVLLGTGAKPDDRDEQSPALGGDVRAE
jgi:hypothetical protein